uniref:Deoxyribonuclease gamma n=1 Tax=Sphaerodactylus townsendi TaxID=933632 RepID=A0ACB8EII0_9SAUR
MFHTCLFLLFLSNTVLSLQICSFNVRSFGEAKRTQPDVLDIIVKVISRCDIILLMEIKDSSNRICPFLLEKLNSQIQDEYSYVVSNRLGRKTYKEQYAFFYRSKMVTVRRTYQYPDLQPGDEDALSREPFVVWFYSPKTVVREFVIIPLHTTPETSVREIDELYDVYLDVKQLWKSESFIFMGDFNAGCNYVAKKHWKNIRLRNHTEFIWLIDDKNDTTVRASTHCPYDREFVIIPLHTTPETSVREIDELYDVYLDVKQLWKSESFIFMGDFNAGCNYVAKKHWKNIRLRNHTEFIWLIDY